MKHLKRLSLYFILAVSTFLFAGCFDLVEQLDMNADGSGKINATLNLSKSRTKVASLMKLKSVNGIDIPSEATVRREMERTVQTLKNTAGISNVQYKLDFNNYIATLSCDFKSVQALNQFSQTLSQQFKTKITSYNSYSYDKATQTFARNYRYMPQIGKEFAKISTEDQKLFADAYYTNIIRFSKPIKSQSNQTAKLSGNSRAVLLKIKATNLIKGTASLSNTITLTK